MMDIEFDKNELLFAEMQESWNKVDDAFFKDHYELSKITGYDALEWRKFYSHPKVVDWMAQELMMLQNAKLRTLMRDLDGNTRSTGLPQLINTLATQTEKASKKNTDGPIFIYTYIPLNEQEKHSPNVQNKESDTSEDIFRD